MREQILLNKEFTIISRTIDNATKCTIADVKEDYFVVELQLKGVYEIDETVEMFTMTDKGQLYFETIVKEVEDNKISLWFPITFKYLQRREYSRILLSKEVQFIKDDEVIDAKILDISAGGIKVITEKQLLLLEKYNLLLELENVKIKCAFQPIRIEASNNSFISSGRFCELNNNDRITLIQYCFGKQIENSNK